MRIWLITVGEPLPLQGSTARPWRTGLLAQLLRQRGHEVVWWTSTVDHFTKQFLFASNNRHVVEPGFELQFLHGRLYRKNISVARLVNHWQIAHQFRRLSASEPVPDTILVSYPTIELSNEAVRYARQRGVRVFIDIRDLWPDEMAARLPRVLRWLAPILLAPIYYSARRALRGATGIVAISQAYLQWARRLARRQAGTGDLWVPLGYNPPPRGSDESAEAERKMLTMGIRPGCKIVWFCGTFVGSIDLGTAIEAARLLEADPQLQFVFTGSGERAARWQAQAAGLGNVVFTGWANQDELAWLSQRAWIGLGAYKSKALMSLPNKLFEYMSAGLPIVSSLTGEAQELIREYHIGVTFKAGDASSLRERIRELSAAPDEVHRMSMNALRTFRQHFDAALVYRRLAEHLEAGAAHQPPEGVRD